MQMATISGVHTAEETAKEVTDTTTTYVAVFIRFGYVLYGDRLPWYIKYRPSFHSALSSR